MTRTRSDRDRRGCLAAIPIGLLALLIAFLSGSARASAPGTPDTVPRLEAAPCPASIGTEERVDCSFLFVRENRQRPGSRTLRLSVMVFHSRASQPASDPIVFLPGGPGGSAVARPLRSSDNPFLDDRAYILLEPRGGRGADPDLECPAVNTLKGRIAAGQLRGVTADVALTRAAGACASRLRAAGVDLDAYTSAETADDLEDLRTALGYRTWNIFGLSYGTRLALTVLRRHPEGVRSVILDSTLPPEVDFDEDASANLWRALDAVFDGCAINHACGAAWPHLRGDFELLLARADRAPLRLPPPAVEFDGKPVVVRGAQVVDAIYAALHRPAQIPLIPRIIGEAAVGDYRELAPLVRSNQGVSSFTWGLRLSVWCGEEAPFEDAARSNAQVSPHVGLAGIDERTASPKVCGAWGVAPAPAIENAPVATDVPVLVLSGEFDPDTPPDWGRGLLAHLPHGRFVSMPGRSHGAGFDRCGATLEVAFLKDPQASLDLGCVLAMPGADFAASARRTSGR